MKRTIGCSGRKKISFVLLVALLRSGLVWAGAFTNAPVVEIGAQDLAQLARVEIDVASIHSRPIREQPGIVSVIPADAIAEAEIIRDPGSAKYGGTAPLLLKGREIFFKFGFEF